MIQELKSWVLHVLTNENAIWILAQKSWLRDSIHDACFELIKEYVHTHARLQLF